jgi:hypothetical protein
VRSLGGISIYEAALTALDEAEGRVLGEGQPVSQLLHRRARFHSALVKRPELFYLSLYLIRVCNQRGLGVAADDTVGGLVGD